MSRPVLKEIALDKEIMPVENLESQKQKNNKNGKYMDTYDRPHFSV